MKIIFILKKVYIKYVFQAINHEYTKSAPVLKKMIILDIYRSKIENDEFGNFR